MLTNVLERLTTQRDDFLSQKKERKKKGNWWDKRRAKTKDFAGGPWSFEWGKRGAVNDFRHSLLIFTLQVYYFFFFSDLKSFETTLRVVSSGFARNFFHLFVSETAENGQLEWARSASPISNIGKKKETKTTTEQSTKERDGSLELGLQLIYDRCLLLFSFQQQQKF